MVSATTACRVQLELVLTKPFLCQLPGLRTARTFIVLFKILHSISYVLVAAVQYCQDI